MLSKKEAHLKECPALGPLSLSALLEWMEIVEGKDKESLLLRTPGHRISEP